MLQGRRNSHDFLNEGDFKALCQGEAAGTRNDGGHGNIARDFVGFFDQVQQGFADIGEMPPVVGEEEGVIFVQHRDFDGGGADVDTHAHKLFH